MGLREQFDAYFWKLDQWIIMSLLNLLNPKKLNDPSLDLDA